MMVKMPACVFFVFAFRFSAVLTKNRYILIDMFHYNASMLLCNFSSFFHVDCCLSYTVVVGQV